MGNKQIFIGLFAILAVIGVAIGVGRTKRTSRLPTVLPTPAPVNVGLIQKTFNLTIPDDMEKTDLVKVGGIEGVGVATRKWQEGRFTLTIMADLPTPVGQEYRAWLENKAGEKVALGNLYLAKGGYLLDFESKINYSDYRKVVVAAKTNLLEGSF